MKSLKLGIPLKTVVVKFAAPPAVFLACLCSAASSAESKEYRRLYLGPTLGASHYLSGLDSDVNKNAVSLKHVFGFRFGKHLAVQGSYRGLGIFEGDIAIREQRVYLSAFSVEAVGIFPVSISGVELFGRTGVARINRTRQFGPRGTTNVRLSSGEGLILSLGASYTMPDFQRLTYHLSYENYFFRFTGVSPQDRSGNKTHSIGVLALGVSLNFKI